MSPAALMQFMVTCVHPQSILPAGLCYMDEGGLVDFRDVVRRHCERKERERALYMSAKSASSKGHKKATEHRKLEGYPRAISR
jgi:hypothetical protein